MKEIFSYVLGFMLTLAKIKNNSTLCEKVRNLRQEHFGSYSNFSYCMHSSVYWVFWPGGRVIDCNLLILCRLSTTGPEHLDLN